MISEQSLVLTIAYDFMLREAQANQLINRHCPELNYIHFIFKPPQKYNNYMMRH